MGAVRPALKVMAQPMQQLKTSSAGGLDAIESDEPDRPLLAAPLAISQSSEPTASDIALEEARKLTRDNPAAVANIVKTWINGEAPA
jgi:flagellar M-ring protein FliF